MPRRIASAEFVISAVLPRDFPTDGRPEVALVGRSNVGKSSLINALVRSAVARTSASPGKTRQVNVYRITPAGGSPFYLMDLPGYGHAGGGVKARREFAALTALYFGTAGRAGAMSGAGRADRSRRIRTPCARSSSRSMRAIPAWRATSTHTGGSHALGVPLLLAATKTDKLSQSGEGEARDAACLRAFGEEPLAVSAITGAGARRDSGSGCANWPGSGSGSGLGPSASGEP